MLKLDIIKGKLWLWKKQDKILWINITLQWRKMEMSKLLLKECYDELEKLNGLVVKSENVDCQFDELLLKVNEELTKEPMTLEEYFEEWTDSIVELQKLARELRELKKEYSQSEFIILTTFDFKKKYGKDNDKIRNGHVKSELNELDDKKHDLELQIEHLKRRIDYIRSLMSIQKSLIDNG